MHSDRADCSERTNNVAMAMTLAPDSVTLRLKKRHSAQIAKNQTVCVQKNLPEQHPASISSTLAMTLGSQLTTPPFFSLDAHAAALLAKHSRQFLPKKFFSPQNLDFDLENPQVRAAGCRNLKNATALTFPSVDAHAAALLAKHSRPF